MANRHILRATVLQALYEWDFRDKEIDANETLTRNLSFTEESVTDEFAFDLLKGVIDHQKEIDQVIEKAAPDWPIKDVSVVDRNILRIGLFELLFQDHKEVPPKVAINEAIEIAKVYGGKTSSRFINGVLGAVYREMGEPGKDQKSKRIKNVNLPDDQVPTEQLVGAIVYTVVGERIMLGMVHDVFGHWTLCKGKIAENESPEEAVKRKVKEELGINIDAVKEKLGENAYIAYDPEKGKIKKNVNYFLVEAVHQDLQKPTKGGLDEAKWFDLIDVPELNLYKDIVPMVAKAVKELSD